MRLIDEKGLLALKKVHLDVAAVTLAEQANEFGAFSNTMTLEFLDKDEGATGDFIVKLVLTVERVSR